MLQRSENPPRRGPHTNGALNGCATDCPPRMQSHPEPSPHSPSHPSPLDTSSPRHLDTSPIPRDQANRLLSAYYDHNLTNLIDVATALNLTALDLLDLLERNDVKSFIARLDAAEEARAASLAIRNKSAGVGGLKTIVEAGAIDSSRDRETLRLACSGLLRAGKPKDSSPGARQRRGRAIPPGPDGRDGSEGGHFFDDTDQCRAERHVPRTPARPDSAHESETTPGPEASPSANGDRVRATAGTTRASGNPPQAKPAAPQAPIEPTALDQDSSHESASIEQYCFESASADTS